MATVTGAILDFLVGDIGWLYVLAMRGLLGVCVFLVFSRYGRIRLGKDDDRPEFRTSSWISMMFAAGMGIALLFYGVAEPPALRGPATGLGRSQDRGGGPGRHGVHVPALGLTGGLSTPSPAWRWPTSATATAGAT